jgi:hypothetical protein
MSCLDENPSMGVITITFLYENGNRSVPTHALNTRSNKGRILWKTVIAPDQTYDSVIQELYTRSRCTPDWCFMWNALFEVDKNTWPGGRHGQNHGDEDEDLIIYCLEPI